MGLLDLFNSDERRKDKVALQIDLATGVLEQCPVCRAVTDRMRDDRLSLAEAEAQAAFDRNDPQVALFAGDRDDLLRRLRSVREPLPFECICQDSG